MPPTTPTTYVYTDEFATATGANRLILTDASGTATINTAAVTTGSYLDLHSGAVDTIAGKSLQIGNQHHHQERLGRRRQRHHHCQ